MRPSPLAAGVPIGVLGAKLTDETLIFSAHLDGVAVIGEPLALAGIAEALKGAWVASIERGENPGAPHDDTLTVSGTRQRIGLDDNDGQINRPPWSACAWSPAATGSHGPALAMPLRPSTRVSITPSRARSGFRWLATSSMVETRSRGRGTLQALRWAALHGGER